MISKNHKDLFKLFLIYTGLFIFTAFFSFLAFQDKSFIWDGDGLQQHAVILEYWGKAIREFFSNPIKNFTMWSWNIGYGESVRPLLNNIASIGDPLYLLAAFFTPEHTERAYTLMVILRFYLVGFAFLVFCIQMHYNRTLSLAGCFAYAFGGFGLYAITKHPPFANPMIHLPLILAGIERYYCKKSRWLLILGTFLSAASGYYFFFMITVITIIYATFRYFHYFPVEGKFFLKFLKKAAVISGWYLVGIALAAVYLVPSFLYLFEGTRLTSLRPVVDSYLHYSEDYYTKFLGSFIVPFFGGWWTRLGFPVFSAFTTISFLFMKGKKSFKAIFFMLTLFLFVPFFGYLLTGTTYISNRWCFAYAFLVVIMMVDYLGGLRKIGHKEVIFAILALGIYPISLLGYMLYIKRINLVLMISYGTVFAFAFVAFFLKKKLKPDSLIPNRIIASVIIVNVIVSANVLFLPRYKNINSFLGEGKFQEIKEKSQSALYTKINDDSFYRVDLFDYKSTVGDKSYEIRNHSMIQDFNGTSLYLSSSRYMFDFYKQLDIHGWEASHSYSSVDNRAFLHALTGIKYIAVNKNEKNRTPYGFTKYMEVDGNIVYKNEYTLPLGYAYDKYMNQREYEKLPNYQKEENLLNSVVLQEGVASEKYEKVVPINASLEIPYKIKQSHNVDLLSDNQWDIKKKKGYVEIEFIPKSEETYISIDQFKFPQNKALKVCFQTENLAKTEARANNRYNWRTTKENILINLEKLEHKKQCIKIIFSQKGKFDFHSLKLIGKDMKILQKIVREHQESELKNIKVFGNKVFGNISLNKSKIMVFSIPFNRGWSAKVNGEKVELLPANTSFFAIPLKSGKNNIELEFRTPGLTVGAMISILTLTGIILLFIWKKYRR